MCFLRHKWSKWGEVRRDEMRRKHVALPNTPENWMLEGYMLVQERVCAECGMVQVRQETVSLPRW